MGTIRFDCDPKKDAEILDSMTKTILPDVAKEPAISAAHICRADEGASNVKTAEQRGRAANMVPRWVVMVEGATEEAVAHALSCHLSPEVLRSLGALDSMQGIYRLQFDLVGRR